MVECKDIRPLLYSYNFKGIFIFMGHSTTFTKSMMQYAREAIFYVAEKYDRVEALNWWEENPRFMAFHMWCNDYDTLMYCYGYKFVLQLMEFYISKEDYENSTAIIMAVNKHNTKLKDIPTHLLPIQLFAHEPK